MLVERGREGSKGAGAIERRERVREREAKGREPLRGERESKREGSRGAGAIERRERESKREGSKGAGAIERRERVREREAEGREPLGGEGG